MRRANNTIPQEEYDRLLREAMQRMSKRIFRLCDEEESKMRSADDKMNYERAERYDFNARALRLIAGLYYEIYRKPKEIKNKLKICEENMEAAREDILTGSTSDLD